MIHQILTCAHCRQPFTFSDNAVRRMPNGVLAYHHLDGCEGLSELAPGSPTPDGQETYQVIGPITPSPEGG